MKRREFLKLTAALLAMPSLIPKKAFPRSYWVQTFGPVMYNSRLSPAFCGDDIMGFYAGEKVCGIKASEQEAGTLLYDKNGRGYRCVSEGHPLFNPEFFKVRLAA